MIDCFNTYKERNLSNGALSGILVSIGILLCIFMMQLVPVEILLWCFTLVIGYVFLRSLKPCTSYRTSDLKLIYITTSLCFGLYTLFTHFQMVDNPDRDVFLTIDSFTFHDVGKDVSSNEWNEFIPFIISKFLYSDYYLFSYILGALYKLDFICGGDNPLLLVKLFNTTIGSLTIGLTYICASFICCDLKVKPFVWFLLFSPLMENSAVLMRDIYVCFFYTWIFYYVLKPKVRCRSLCIILLSILCILIRPENGLFALGFICLRYFTYINSFKRKKKILIFSFICILGIAAIIYILPIAQHTLAAYQERDIGAASSGSLGVIMKSLPIPFNFIIPAVFSQMMPFPFWFNLTRAYGGEFTFLSVVSPFYWLAIWIVICYAMKSKMRIILKRDKLLIYSLVFAFLYIMMTSYGEINVRRIMGVYPIIFVIYLSFKKYVSRFNRFQLGKFSTIALLSLNIIYFIIK